MIRPLTQSLSLFVPMLLILAHGCGDQSKPLTLQALSKKLSGVSSPRMVEMAFNPVDADQRREGITLLSKRKWGLKEPYLKGYAALLQTDQDPLVRSAAVRALGKAGDTKYISYVIVALGDKSPTVRWDAAVALDSMIDQRAIEPLGKHALKDNSPDVRAACVWALRHYRVPRVIRLLKASLMDEEFSVRYQAHAALVSIIGKDLGYDSQDWPETVPPPSSKPTPKKKFRWKWWKPSPKNATAMRTSKEIDRLDG